MIQLDLKGKKILVTGASNGIGKSIAGFLMRMGATVAVHYNTDTTSANRLITTFPETKSKSFKADLGNQNEVENLFKNVIDTFGGLDSIVLNAGIFLAHSTRKDTHDWYATWKKTMDVNLNSVGLLTKLGIDHFVKKNQGTFVFIGSRAVFRGETEEYLAYAASKGGLVALARSVARSFGKQNIKSFVVSPGFTRTQMAEQFIEDHGEEKVLSELALNRLTTPEDIAPMVGMMCSGYMDHATGATIDINAGSHIR
ncbi:SDR family oxidoreductase [Aquimarina sp. U1-2]|uniref:SDR family NAD(P)-dependent oxidoreductase n=1 Tax=Aquimarina sp. U1-2 TaxID=2823141 RepID=UPI001AECD9A7|nr:SDR family oxidoreductase [Aquimarina sp. U1-2]MBP2831940.1 SDR family oxidoreductase [Aquimarina sp. U1-2]